jgi:AcrR family transcriptional regulator
MGSPAPLHSPDAKRQAIIAAAANAFARDGFANARICDIADAAAVGKGTVYEYFASKEDLLLACCLSRCAQDRAVIRRTLAERLPALAALVPEDGAAAASTAPLRLDDPVGALRELLVIAITHLLTHASRDCRLFMELFALSGEREEMKARVRPAIHAVLAQWEATLGAMVGAGIAAGRMRPHPDIPGLARLFSATVDGLLLQRTWRDDLPPAELAARTADAFIATLVVDPRT